MFINFRHQVQIPMIPMCRYFLSRASGNSFRNTTPRRLLVFTDSLDSVAVLNSLHASEPLHNSVLLAIAEIVMKPVSIFEFIISKVKRISKLICFHVLCLMSFIDISLLTASAHSLLQGISCRRDGSFCSESFWWECRTFKFFLSFPPRSLFI